MVYPHHISGHPWAIYRLSAGQGKFAGQRRSTTVPRNQLKVGCTKSKTKSQFWSVVYLLPKWNPWRTFCPSCHPDVFPVSHPTDNYKALKWTSKNRKSTSHWHHLFQLHQLMPGGRDTVDLRHQKCFTYEQWTVVATSSSQNCTNL